MEPRRRQPPYTERPKTELAPPDSSSVCRALRTLQPLRPPRPSQDPLATARGSERRHPKPRLHPGLARDATVGAASTSIGHRCPASQAPRLLGPGWGCVLLRRVSQSQGTAWGGGAGLRLSPLKGSWPRCCSEGAPHPRKRPRSDVHALRRAAHSCSS